MEVWDKMDKGKMMDRIFMLILSIASCQSFGQGAIDLKTLIGKTQDKALHYFANHELNLAPSDKHDNLWVGYNDGIQVKITDGVVRTIWVEFTDRRTGAFPIHIDSVITPNVHLEKVISAYVKPYQTGGGLKIGNTYLNGWAKWTTAEYQLHCEVVDSIIIMVTLMEPDWYPGKE